ncbi:MAG: haloacid dehalogenase-like hydrolase [Oscillospiraceae bacterium]|nr:haloacid dehalogenase-like hydrolase [Oscillospiraceae bacterium]
MAKKPTMALLYDFDKTLSTKDMQEYSFIPKIGMKPADFWAESNRLAKEQKMDKMLAYMYVMLDRARSAKFRIHRQAFVELGKDAEFYKGVEEWFEAINQYANELNIELEHYIISSGLREILEGTSIFKYFKEVFACEYYYDENEVACWPKNLVNYTTKTQFLTRINKGVLDISEDDALNQFTPEEQRPIPFRNMIYIGDGYTDIPCMKLVKEYGGYSIAVYPKTKKETARRLLNEGRVDFIVPADYSKEGKLFPLVCSMLRKMEATDGLKQLHSKQIAEGNL